MAMVVIIFEDDENGAAKVTFRSSEPLDLNNTENMTSAQYMACVALKGVHENCEEQD